MDRPRGYNPVHFLLRVLSKSHVSPGVTPAVHLRTLSMVIIRPLLLDEAGVGLSALGTDAGSSVAQPRVLVNAAVHKGILEILVKIFKWEAT